MGERGVGELAAVLGVDCASGKSAVFDGNEFADLKPRALDDRLRDFHDQHEVCLICWDAPLTGPPTTEEICDGDGAYSMRPIERFCNPARTTSPLWKTVGGDRPPSGVNTRGYSGMSHWAITQALTGHPRINSRYQREPRFPLLTESLDAAGDVLSPFPLTDRRLAEVHPAVALWLWIWPELGREEREEKDRFAYKVSKSHTEGKRAADVRDERTRDLAKRLLAVLDERPGVKVDAHADGEHLLYGQLGREELLTCIGGDHNKLDAYVAWVLGRLAIHCPEEVIQLGSREHGAFLLPYSVELTEAWREFRLSR